MKQSVFAFSLLAMVSISCEPSGEFITGAKGAEYFPLQTGAFQEYDVDSTAILSNVETRYQFQLRVEVREEFGNATGNKSYVILRQKRQNPGTPWVAAGTWSAWVDARSAVQAEGNERFVKLRFPLEVGTNWNGNEMNSAGGDDDCGGVACDRYEIVATEPDVIVIQSKIEDVLVKYDVRIERYAENVGLAYKEITVLEYCTSQSCFGKQFVDKGVKYKQLLTDHGTI